MLRQPLERQGGDTGQERAMTLWVEGKKQSWFNVSVRALSDAPATFKLDVVQVVGQSGGDTASYVPCSTLSVIITRKQEHT